MAILPNLVHKDGDFAVQPTPVCSAEKLVGASSLLGGCREAYSEGQRAPHEGLHNNGESVRVNAGSVFNECRLVEKECGPYGIVTHHSFPEYARDKGTGRKRNNYVLKWDTRQCRKRLRQIRMCEAT